MSSENAALAGAPFETQTKLTQIAQAVSPGMLIADEACPRVRTAYKFTYTTLSEQDLLTIPDVRASRAGRLNQVEFGTSDTTDSVIDYGLEDPVPYRDIDEAAKQEVPFDPLEQATVSTAELVKLAREKRVADLLFSDGNYAAGHKATLADGAQWSHADSNRARRDPEGARRAVGPAQHPRARPGGVDDPAPASQDRRGGGEVRRRRPGLRRGHARGRGRAAGDRPCAGRHGLGIRPRSGARPTPSAGCGASTPRSFTSSPA